MILVILIPIFKPENGKQKDCGPSGNRHLLRSACSWFIHECSFDWL